MEPSPTESEPHAVESAIARVEERGPVLGYAARPAGVRRIWRWIRPGSVLFFVGLAALAAGAGWGGWKWRLAADRKALEECATMYSGSRGPAVSFNHAPSSAALRHMARLTGPVQLMMGWPESENTAAAQAFGAANLGNVLDIGMGNQINADLLLKQLTRPDSGLKSLTGLGLQGTNVTDAGLKDLARADSAIKALTALDLSYTMVTDAGLKELSRHDSGFKWMTWLNLSDTNVTDAGLKELTRPDSGLKALARLNLDGTKVTNAGVAELQSARPGLRIVR